jgi:hypothetical protein
MSKAKAIRRVVTGHRADGRSTVLRDTPAPNVKQRQAGNASTLLRDFGIGAGDVVVQRGTNHAWINRGDTVCRLGMVFIDAEEPAELAALR